MCILILCNKHVSNLTFKTLHINFNIVVAQIPPVLKIEKPDTLRTMGDICFLNKITEMDVGI